MKRKNGVALWRQIADRIRQEISAGTHDATGMLPPEMSLSEKFGVNRHTVRSAIAALASEGIVEPLQGRGTMIIRKGRLSFPISKRTRFTAGISDQVKDMEALLLSHSTEQANEDLASRLKLNVGDFLIRMEILRKADHRPVSRSTTWFPASRFSGIEEAYRASGSITSAFAKLGLSDYIRATTVISATHADTGDLSDLELSPGAIVLVTQALNTDMDGTPVQYAISRFSADSVEFTIDN
ncbi:phosphonate metabolism transcriptional regulator PhnF [Rhizobium sp. RM]|uniref:phosphonate metabolism transcriptional regulator PhnF n=1 Tax=Rhizobium/Agrobacterium group TaxID=227290 RepID=UPI00110D540F|nr:phosphonate metabolism transcriptional regulator PhnF [Rhizobium sp. RM]NWJ24502.1 phosphonate metabolism transcriptional regulator PhnF [Rhizobium sp. RM]TMV16316.1 phosphonate metabolism transcriptional regulator PhnF [Rhizobium sp. Td3]